MTYFAKHVLQMELVILALGLKKVGSGLQIDLIASPEINLLELEVDLVLPLALKFDRVASLQALFGVSKIATIVLHS